MKQQHIHYLVLGIVSVAAFAVVLYGFNQYNADSGSFSMNVASANSQISSQQTSQNDLTAAVSNTTTTSMIKIKILAATTCHNFMSVPTANNMINVLQLNQAQSSQILNPSHLFLNSSGSGGPGVDMCFDSGFVSNVPSTIAVRVLNFPTKSYSVGASLSRYSYLIPLPREWLNNSSTIGTVNVVSSTTYNVNVNYDYSDSLYNAEMSYTGSGTQNKNVTVFKFAGIPNVGATGDESAYIYEELAYLGYRPATIDELNAVKGVAGCNVVALGTKFSGASSLFPKSYGNPLTCGQNIMGRPYDAMTEEVGVGAATGLAVALNVTNSFSLFAAVKLSDDASLNPPSTTSTTYGTNSSNSYVTSSSATSTTSATASTITPYTVSVNYDKFTAESNKYGYTSVYTTTGTKSVSIAVVKLSSGSSLTASQAIASLSTMGYRPATLSEIYALKLAQPSVAIGTLVALGTNLGGSYGYPTGFGGGAAGLGHFAGPFNTNAYKFAAVENN